VNNSGTLEQWQAVFGSGAGFAFFVAYYVLYAVAMWRVFSKAGYPGILALIPIVNWFFLVKVAGLSAWWALLAIVPIVNVVFYIIVALRVGRAYGHGAIFSILLLVLFAPIGHFIIGLSADRYTRPV